MTSICPFQLTVFSAARPGPACRDRLDERIQIGRRLAVDFGDAPAGIQPIVRRGRSVEEERDEHAVGSDAALRRHRPVRGLQRRARPDQDPVDVAAVERTVFSCSVFSAPSRQTVTATSGFCTARSTSRKRLTTLPSIASSRSPGSSSAARACRRPADRCRAPAGAAGRAPRSAAPTRRASPSLRALASDWTSNSASKEYSGRPPLDDVDHLA